MDESKTSLGEAGCGMHFKQKLNIMQRLANGENIIIIDPNNEYSEFSRIFGGTVTNDGIVSFTK